MPDSLTDAELITAARGGDADAWRELYARWLPWVWRSAYRLLNDRHAADDVASEAMTAWVRRLNGSAADAPQLAAWLRTVVRNKAADHIRRVTRQRRAVESVARLQSGRAGQGGNASRDGDGPTSMECKETRDEVRQTLASLSDQQQLMLELKYSEGLSVRQIADRLGATEKSVEAGLYRARREFRRRYETRQHQHASRAAVAPTEDQVLKIEQAEGGIR